MLFVLGIGSNIAMCSCIVTAIRDQFPKVNAWQAVLMVAAVGFSVGLCYVTPVNIISSCINYMHQFFYALTRILNSLQGGQFILVLVDFFGASFIAYILAIAEIVAVCWIYGILRIFPARFINRTDLYSNIGFFRSKSSVPRRRVYDRPSARRILAFMLGIPDTHSYGCNFNLFLYHFSTVGI